MRRPFHWIGNETNNTWNYVMEFLHEHFPSISTFPGTLLCDMKRGVFTTMSNCSSFYGMRHKAEKSGLSQNEIFCYKNANKATNETSFQNYMSHVRNAKQHELFIKNKSKFFKLFHNGYLQ